MANTLAAVIERAGRISPEAGQARYAELVRGFIRERHKAAIDARLIRDGFGFCIPEGDRK